MPGASLFSLLHSYIYARYTYPYIRIGSGEGRLGRLYTYLVERLSPHLGWLFPAHPGDPGRGFADTYHGKVLLPQMARQLVSVREEISITFPEQVIPYSQARDLVLRQPAHITVLDCPCRVARQNPCLPLDVCLIVGEPFASLVIEHHPRRSRRITSDEALEILAAEHARGHVHHAFFKDAMLGRFYAICNCCSCCCGAMQAFRNGVPMLASSGYLSQVDAELCTGCGLCASACPFSAITLLDKRAVIDPSRCMGCGVCVSRCRRGALALVLDPQKSLPLELPPS